MEAGMMKGILILMKRILPK